MTHTMHTAINAFEVLEIARRIERNGASFYRKAAEHTSSQNLRQTLLNLADAEDSHEKTFVKMAEQLQYDERKVTLFEPVAEIAENLSAIADSKVFNLQEDFSKQLTVKETVADILKIAIDKEKDSIIFYVGLKDIVPAKGGKDKVDAIIREELGHLASLSDQLEHSR